MISLMVLWLLYIPLTEFYEPLYLAVNSNITGKPVQPEDLRKIEFIVNQQIKDELGVYALEIKLEDAKRINGLRAVFGEVSFLDHEMLIFLVWLVNNGDHIDFCRSTLIQ